MKILGTFFYALFLQYLLDFVIYFSQKVCAWL
jgi:hypothetical protein